MNQKQRSTVPSGIVFALLLIFNMISTFTKAKSTGIFNAYDLFLFAGYALLAFALLTSRRGILLMIGFAIPTLEYIRQLWQLVFFTTGAPANYYVRAILLLLAWCLASLFALSLLTDRLPKFRKIARKLWFLPALFVFAEVVVYYTSFGRISFRVLFLNLRSYLPKLLASLALLLSMRCLAVPAREKKEKSTEATDSANNNEAYCGMAKHVLLLLFTCGIWQLIWIYRVTKHTNAVQGEAPRNPTKKLLLYIFVPFYSIYWTYKTAQRLDKMASERGIASDIATLCLILSIFVSIIPPILMQDKLNTIVTAKVQPMAASNAVSAELKELKDLLDSGVITQEEFEAKKKQLLGL